MTAPSQVSYRDVLRVWREADAIPQIEHAWLYDHLMPIGGDPNGPTFEGWTLLAVYPGSGHALGAPYVPTGDSVHRYGGTAAANARANEDSWSEVTALLGTSLRR